jgi:hypothetical protein
MIGTKNEILKKRQNKSCRYLKYFTLFSLLLLVISNFIIVPNLFGTDDILKSKTRNIVFKDTKNFEPSDITYFTVGDNDGWYYLIAHTAADADRDSIIKTRLHNTAVAAAFDPSSVYYINQITARITDGWAYLTAYNSNGDSGEIFKTMLSGIATKAWFVSANNSIQNFYAYTATDTSYLSIGEPLATELIGWDYLYKNGIVQVSWITEIEMGVYKWVVHRKEEGDINYIPVCERSSQVRGNYMFVDSTVLGGQWYYYQLCEFNGVDTIWHGEQKVWVLPRVKVLLSLSEFPNPVGGRYVCSLRYSVPGIMESSGKSLTPYKEISLKVYDSSGRVVRTLVDEQKGAGYYAIEWDLKTANGREVRSGTYFVKFEVQSDKEKAKLKKVIVVR